MDDDDFDVWAMLPSGMKAQAYRKAAVSSWKLGRALAERLRRIRPEGRAGYLESMRIDPATAEESMRIAVAREPRELPQTAEAIKAALPAACAKLAPPESPLERMTAQVEAAMDRGEPPRIEADLKSMTRAEIDAAIAAARSSDS